MKQWFSDIALLREDRGKTFVNKSKNQCTNNALHMAHMQISKPFHKLFQQLVFITNFISNLLHFISNPHDR